MCDFLLVFYCDHVPIFYRFRVITIYWSKSRPFYTPQSRLKPSQWLIPYILGTTYGLKKLEPLGYPAVKTA